MEQSWYQVPGWKRLHKGVAIAYRYEFMCRIGYYGPDVVKLNGTPIPALCCKRCLAGVPKD